MSLSITKKIVTLVESVMKTQECSVCLELLKQPVSIGCGHFFCRQCISEMTRLNYRGNCPLCKKTFTRRAVQEIPQRQDIAQAIKNLALKCSQLTGVKFKQLIGLSDVEEVDSQSVIPLCDANANDSISKVKEKRLVSKKRKSSEMETEENEDSEPTPTSVEAAEMPQVDQKKSNDLSHDEEISRTSLQGNKRHCQSQDSDSDDILPDLPSIESLLNDSSMMEENVIGDQKNAKDQSQKRYIVKTKNLRIHYGEKVRKTEKSKVQSKLTTFVSAKKCSPQRSPVVARINRSSRTKSHLVSSVRNRRAVSIKNKINALKNKTNKDSDSNYIDKDGFLTKVSVEKDKTSTIAPKSSSGNKEDSKENEINLFSTPPFLDKNEKELASRETSNKSELKKLRLVRKGIAKKKAAKDSNSSTEEVIWIKKICDAESSPLNIEKENEKEKVVCTLAETSILDICKDADDVVKISKDLNSNGPFVSTSPEIPENPNISKYLLSKSPGWSRCKRLNKDFHLKGKSKLEIQKSTSTKSVCENAELSVDKAAIESVENSSSVDANNSKVSSNARTGKAADDKKISLISDRNNVMRKCEVALRDIAKEAKGSAKLCHVPSKKSLMNSEGKIGTVSPDRSCAQSLKITQISKLTTNDNLLPSNESNTDLPVKNMKIQNETLGIQPIESSASSVIQRSILNGNEETLLNEEDFVLDNEVVVMESVEDDNFTELGTKTEDICNVQSAVAADNGMEGIECEKNIAEISVIDDCPEFSMQYSATLGLQPLNMLKPMHALMETTDKSLMLLPKRQIFDTHMEDLNKEQVCYIEHSQQTTQSLIEESNHKSVSVEQCQQTSPGLFNEDKQDIVFQNEFTAEKCNAMVIEHSQQTSQCLSDETRHRFAAQDDFGTKRHTIPLQQQVCPYQPILQPQEQELHASVNSRDRRSSGPRERTKVVKRTCLTLEEIQDYFDKSAESDSREVICSMPFLSGDFQLQLSISDETLNVSVLKVFNSQSEITASSDLGIQMPDPCTNCSSGLLNLKTPGLKKLYNECHKLNAMSGDNVIPVITTDVGIQTLDSDNYTPSLAAIVSGSSNDTVQDFHDISKQLDSDKDPFPFLSTQFKITLPPTQIYKPVASSSAVDTLLLVSQQPNDNKAGMSGRFESPIRYSDSDSPCRTPTTTHAPVIMFTTSSDADSQEEISSQQSISKVVESLKNQAEIVNNDVKVTVKVDSIQEIDMLDETSTTSEEIENQDNILFQRKEACHLSEAELPLVKKSDNFQRITDDMEINDTKDHSHIRDRKKSPKNKTTIHHPVFDMPQDELANSSSDEFDPFAKDPLFFRSTPMSHGANADFEKMIQESENLSSDPDMAFATDLVAPLKNLAQKQKSDEMQTDQILLQLKQMGASAPPKPSSRLRRRLKAQPRSSSDKFNPVPNAEPPSLLNTQKRFKRIKNLESSDDSDCAESESICVKNHQKSISDEMDKTLSVSSEDSDDVNEELSKAQENVGFDLNLVVVPRKCATAETTSLLIKDVSTFGSSISEDVPSEAPTQLKEQIKELTGHIEEIEKKLKQQLNGECVDVPRKTVEDFQSEDFVEGTDILNDTKCSEDIFSQTIPPTPPEAIANPNESSLSYKSLFYKRP